MKKLTAVLAGALCALAVAGGAGAAIIGVNEDAPAFATDGGASFYSDLQDVGMTQNVVSVKWDPDNPTTIPNQDRLQQAIDVAHGHDVDVVLAVYPAKARAIADHGLDGFVAFVRQVTAAFPDAGAIICGNEPNQTRFWQPQFNDDGTPAAPAAFWSFLVGCHDAVKSVNGNMKVIATGLSPRGNDMPNAASNVSESPIRFIQAMGAAWRAAGSPSLPWDAWSMHPYPNVNTDAPTKGMQWPGVAMADIPREEAALYDAFDYSGPIDLDEVGWQVDTSGLAGYNGDENVPTIDEATQADYYSQVVKMAACDPRVESVSFFHFIDESDRDRWQSGEERVDGSHRPSYDAIKQAIVDTAGGSRCVSAQQTAFTPSTTVANAAAAFGALRPLPWSAKTFTFSLYAEEDATYKAAIFQVAGPAPVSAVGTALLQRTLASVAKAKPRPAVGSVAVASATGTVKAYWKPTVTLRRRTPLAPGWYVYAATLHAVTNPGRVSTFVSAPFRVLAKPAAHKPAPKGKAKAKH